MSGDWVVEEGQPRPHQRRSFLAAAAADLEADEPALPHAGSNAVC